MSATTATRASGARQRRGPIGALLDRFGHLVHELGKFGTVGAVAYAVDSVLYLAALRADWEPVTAKILVTIVSATVAFLGNRFWTWRHRERSGLAREYGLYFFFNIVGMVIALTCVGFNNYALGSLSDAFRSDLANFIAANVVGMALGSVFRFWSYRRFVFLAPVPVLAVPAPILAVPVSVEPAVTEPTTEGRQRG